MVVITKTISYPLSDRDRERRVIRPTERKRTRVYQLPWRLIRGATKTTRCSRGRDRPRRRLFFTPARRRASELSTRVVARVDRRNAIIEFVYARTYIELTTKLV